jgi:hypothetical protein
LVKVAVVAVVVVVVGEVAEVVGVVMVAVELPGLWRLPTGFPASLQRLP